MTDQDDAAIVIFARHPTPGKVKTRLAKDTGGEAAAQFYKTCAEHVISRALRFARRCWSLWVGMLACGLQQGARFELSCLYMCSAEGCICYLFYSLAEEEQLVKAWLAPLGQVGGWQGLGKPIWAAVPASCS
jgi:hypothetical protein